MKSKKMFLLFSLIVTVFNFEYILAQEFHATITSPAYKDGLPALKEFLSKNIRYPEDLRKEGISGVVSVGYYVNEQGKVEDIKIIRGINALCDSEAVRVTRLLNGWQPAVQFGSPVKVRIIMPVFFGQGNDNKKENEFTVTGKVFDKSTGKPLEGLLVLVKGTSMGAITDKEGHYNIIVPGEDSELEYSSMGYEIKKEKVGKNRIINVALFTNDFIIDFDFNQFK